MNDLLQLGLANALVAAMLAVPAYCLSRWGKRPALAHVFWLFILIKLVTPPIWRVPVSLDHLAANFSNREVQPAKPVNPTPPASEPREILDSGNVAFLRDERLLPAALLPELIESSIPSTSVDAGVVQQVVEKQTAASPIPWRMALAVCWLTGSAVMLCLTLFRLTSFVRCLRRVWPVQGPMQQLALELSQRLGLRATPQLGIAPMRMAPLVWGWGSNARVIIPRELWNTLDQDQRTMLLVHELAHLKRGDHWVRLLELVVRPLYWWHPVVWLAARELREAEEQCCDAWAVWALPHAARSYARALMDTVDFLSQRSVPLPVGASGIGQVQDLRRRLIMIMRGTTPRKLSGPMLVSLLIVGGTIVLLGPSFGQQQSNAESALLDEPVRMTAQSTTPAVRGVRFTEPVVDDELEQLRQQEANLRRAMEALARTLEQTKRQLDSIEGLPARAPMSPLAAPRRIAPVQPVPAPEAQPRAAATPQRPANALPRTRPVREIPVEDRLSRLEERMSQIAEDLQALRRDLRPRTPSARPLGVPSPDMAPPTIEPPTPRRQPRPPAGAVPTVPSAAPLPPGATLDPAPSVPPLPPGAVPAADSLDTPRPRIRNLDSDDLAPPAAQPRRLTPPAAPAAPTRPTSAAPATKSADEKPESPTVR
jgi:beta-lactamase regulating signal transducer with metallopeptidase domain